ncbi:exported hypothetical protein [Candidatus Zixiibacteriota bacterium]|nr:exported hypothetical protein [candidate division Zixibacteria bacterium]
MKRFSTILILAVAAVFAGAVWGLAQMGMMSNSGNNNAAASSSTTDFSTIMNNMNSHYQMMSRDYDSLKQNYGRMMSLNSMNKLHKAMQQYRVMMATMADNMM